MELLLDDYRLVAELPQSFPYGAIARERQRQAQRPWLRGLAILATVILGTLILQAGPVATNPVTTFTVVNELSSPDSVRANRRGSGTHFLTPLTNDRGVRQLAFWVLVALDLYILFTHVQGQRPPHLLRDLKEKDPNRRRQDHREPDGAINILPYFTENARRAIEDAVRLAEQTGSTLLTPQIFLASLVCTGKTALIISRLERDPKSSCQFVVDRLPNESKPAEMQVHFHPGTRSVILAAFAEAWDNGFDSVDVEDFLLVMAKHDGPEKELLDELELDYEQIRSIAFWMNEELAALHQWQFWRERGRLRPKGHMNRAWTARPTPFLDRYSRDITQLAAVGNVPIVKVRDQQINQIIRILGSGDRNNALVVGEPGVGKTSIIGAVAARMVEERVPEPLKDKRLVELDLAALVSGGSTAEQNLDHVLQEVKDAGNIILFIGHVESLVSSQGGLSAATLLEAASKSAQLQIIGTATYGDYHRYIESNPTFANSFQKVDVPEVSPADAVTILEEESPVIQSKYKILLTFPAIEASVKLSARYIQDQVLPEKALSVLSDAAARATEQKKKFVTREIVEQVVAERVHVPVQEMNADERNKLQQLGEELKKRVIGQPEAVQRVAEALRRARTGLKDEKRPIGSFLFVGPTGVGKTETARSLAALYYGDEKAMVRIDMSEYQDAKAIYRLIGAPASTAAEFAEGGALTQVVRERPYCLILLDELEKAHPDVHNLFLQLLDDGRLTENTGRTVSYANTIVIATSNAGAPEIMKMIEQNLSADEINRQALPLLQQFFKPEFINRFDAVVTFRPLTMENVQKIAGLMLGQVIRHLQEQGVDAEFTPEVVAIISRLGFDPRYGARPLRRAIQDYIETPLADLLLSEQINKKEHVIITPEMLHLTDQAQEKAPRADQIAETAPNNPQEPSAVVS